jgi:hypothetical protein
MGDCKTDRVRRLVVVGTLWTNVQMINTLIDALTNNQSRLILGDGYLSINEVH